MKKMNYPADYAVLSNEEMTYTTGGGTIDDAAGIATTAATVVGAVVLASSYVWGCSRRATETATSLPCWAAPPMPLPPIWANLPATLYGTPFPPPR